MWHDSFTCGIIWCVTKWRRPIGCLTLQVIFCKRATSFKALLRKMTCKDKASWGSSPPCTPTVATLYSNWWYVILCHTRIYIWLIHTCDMAHLLVSHGMYYSSWWQMILRDSFTCVAVICESKITATHDMCCSNWWQIFLYDMNAFLYIYMYIHACLHVHMQCIAIHVYIYARMHFCIDTYKCISTHMYI